MATTQAETELGEYKEGKFTLEQLASIWAARQFDEPDIPHGAENEGDLGGPGTFDEITKFMLTGELSEPDYYEILEKVFAVNKPSA